MKILYTCSELGLGHVSRSILLGKRLISEGYKISFASGGWAYKLLKDTFRNVDYCTPVSWHETAQGIMPITSILNIFIPLPTYDLEQEMIKIKRPSAFETINRYYDERKALCKNKADVVISDGDITALRVAQKWGKSSIFITNLIRPNYKFNIKFFVYPGQRLVERYIRNSDRIIIPDLPPPYTICERNLGNLDQLGIRDKVKFVGPFYDMSYEKGSEELIFASITGPPGSRERLKQEIIPVLSNLDQESVVSLGEPHSNFYRKSGKCTIFGWMTKEGRKRYMKRAKIFIIPGSHGTCFEAIKHGKPSICIPTQIEQRANAMKLKELNCSLFTRGKKDLKRAIEQIEEEYSKYKKETEKMANYACKFNGLERATEIIKGRF